MMSDVTISEAVEKEYRSPAPAWCCRCYFMASFNIALGIDCGCRPVNGKTCFLMANEVLNPASCLYQEHLG